LPVHDPVTKSFPEGQHQIGAAVPGNPRALKPRLKGLAGDLN